MAQARADVPDPRSIITPDAFSVDPELLGLPLASPRRRLAAMFVDLVVVWLITLLLGGLGLVLGVAAAAFFVWMATRKEGADRVFTWVFRVAVGCLGLFILLATAGIFWLVGSGIFSGDGGMGDLGDMPGTPPGLGDAIREGIMTEGREQIRAGIDERGLAEIESSEEAGEVLRELARVSEKVGFRAGETRALLEDAIPEDAPWAAGADSMVSEAMAVAYGEAGAGAGEDTADAPATADTAAGGARPSGSADEEEASPGGAAGEEGSEGMVELGRPEASAGPGAEVGAGPGAEVGAGPGAEEGAGPGAALPAEAADSIAVLLARLEDLEAEREALEIEVDARDETIDELEERLEEAEEGGGGSDLWASFQGLGETAGIDFGFFGWFVLYFAFLMPRLGGRTVGKRMLGIRVLQLDGGPMNWFEAFERAGGYAAGFATGLLGFAQVYWDPNRQAIHDKIAGTVVIDERKPRVPGTWERAVARPGRVDPGPERKGGGGPGGPADGRDEGGRGGPADSGDEGGPGGPAGHSRERRR